MSGGTHAVIGWFNGALYLGAALACFGALNKMQWGRTRPCVIGATLLLAVGCAGQFGAAWKDEWAIYADSALAGGVLALVLASQRVHSSLLERFANPVATLAILVTAALFMLGIATAHAAPLFQGVGSNDQPVALRLYTAACSHPKIVEHLKIRIREEYREGWRAAALYWGGRTWASCWRELNGQVYSLDEEGAPLEPVPLRFFREDTI